MQTEVIVALIAAFAALAAALITYFKGAKKDEVDALRGIIQELRDYIEKKDADYEDLQEWAEKLVCQIKEAGMEPVHFHRSERKAKK